MTDFLRDLWRFKPEDSWILLWSLKNGRSEFYSNVEPAIDAAQRLGGQGDVYVGVGLRAQSLPSDKRGGTADIAGIAALWLDVDVVSDAHQKINLFPSKDEAEHFVLQVTPLAPSYTVDTGHGLQMWWLFTEPWMFANEAERRSAIDLSRRWSNTFRFRAHERHLDIDAVHDLARILRIPGTYNYKDVERGGKRLPVTIRKQQYRGSEIARYSPADFEPHLLESPETDPDQIVDVGEFVINLMAEPPLMKFELLSETSVKFRRSWLHDRPDMTDTSLSAYDMSLASVAGHAGWSVQEVVDLIIAHRRKYGESGSHKNMEDYLRRTLRKCMPTPGTPRAAANPEIDPPTTPPIAAPSAPKATEHAAMMQEIAGADNPSHKLSILSGMLRPLEIAAVVKYLTDPPSYVMDTNFGKIRFDKTEALTTQASFRNHVYSTVGRMPSQKKRGDWDDILNIIGDVMEEQEVANDATDEGIIISYLVHYLSERSPTDNEADAFRSQSAFYKEGQVFIFGAAFRMWIYAHYRHQMIARDFGLLMRNAGAKERIMNFTATSGKRTSRYCWAVPPAVVEFILGEE